MILKYGKCNSELHNKPEWYLLDKWVCPVCESGKTLFLLENYKD